MARDVNGAVVIAVIVRHTLHDDSLFEVKQDRRARIVRTPLGEEVRRCVALGSVAF